MNHVPEVPQSSDDACSDLFEAIISGIAIDWRAAEQRGGPALVERLRALQRLTGAFEQARSGDMGNRTDDRPVLFDWGHLRVLAELGSGAESTVYRAFDTVLERDVALKLRTRSEGTSAHDDAFIEEARRIARVRHPGVLAVLGAATHGGRTALWTDLVEGETLLEKLQRSGSFDRSLTARTLQALADALAAVHAAGLVHGDVKASNVMLDHERHPVLMDFGAGSESTGPRSGASAGTPSSMAPELFLEGRSSTAADIYALGVLGFQMLSGELPLPCGQLAELRACMLDHRQRIAAALRRLPRGPLRRLLGSMLASDPGQRPGAMAVRAQLDWIIGAPLRRRRMLVMGSVILLLAIASALTGLAYLSAEAARYEATRNYQRAHTINEFMREMLGRSKAQFSPNVRVLDLLGPSVAQAEIALADQPEALAAVLFAAGESYLSLDQPEQAALAIARSLELAREVRDQRRPFDSKIERAIRVRLADAHSQRGDADTARELLDTLELELQRELDGNGNAQHPRIEIDPWLADIDSIRSDLARNAGDHAASAGKLRSAIGLRERLPATPDNLRSLSGLYGGLGAALAESGQFDEAETMFHRAISIAEGRIAPNAGVLIAARNGIATILSRRGDNRGAETMYRLSLAEYRRAGYMPQDAFSLLANLSIALKDQGRYEEAITTCNEILQHYSGTEDVLARLLVQSVRITLADTYRLQGQWATAIEVLQLAFEQATADAGVDHPQTLVIAINLSEVLIQGARIDQGESLAISAEQRATRVFGDMHPIPQEAREMLGLAELGRGDARGARSRLQAVLEAKDAIYGARTPATEPTRLRLAEALNALGEHDHAQRLLREVANEREQRLGAEHPLTQAVRELPTRGR